MIATGSESSNFHRTPTRRHSKNSFRSTRYFSCARGKCPSPLTDPPTGRNMLSRGQCPTPETRWESRHRDVQDLSASHPLTTFGLPRPFKSSSELPHPASLQDLMTLWGNLTEEV